MPVNVIDTAKRRVTLRRLVASVFVLVTLAYALRPAGVLLSLGLLASTQLSLLVALGQRSFLRRALVVTLSATLALTVGEIVAGRLWPISPHRILPFADSPVQRPYLPDPQLGTVQTPNFRGYFVHPEYEREVFETGADGFRGAAWDSPLPAEGARVLLLGDSTAVGFGVGEAHTISGVLEDLLNGTGQPARVFNAAVAGYGPRHERILLERLVDRVRPTHVVAICYDGNDLPNCRAQFVLARRNGLHDLRLPTERDGPDSVHRPSRPPSLLSRWYWSHRSALYYRVETVLMPWLTSTGLLKHHVYRGILRLTRAEPTADVAEELDLAIEAITGMAETCQEMGAEFLLVRMPMRVQTEVASFEHFVRLYGLDPAQQDRSMPGRALLESCADLGIQTLDLLPVFEVPGRDANVHYYTEGHPNRRGNQVTAGCIAETMSALGVLK